MRILYFIAALMLAVIAQAQESLSVEQALQGLLQTSAQQCKLAEQRMESDKGKHELVVQLAIEDGHKTICECTPSRIRAQLAELPARELQRKISSQEELLAVIRPKVLGPCAAEQLRRPFTYRCEDRIKSVQSGIDAPAFCACMQKAVNAVPEDQAVEIGLATAEHLARAAEAKRNGQPDIPRPAILEPLMKTQAQCRAQARAKTP